MICPTCGKEVENHNLFCIYCGQQLQHPEETGRFQTPPMQPITPQMKAPATPSAPVNAPPSIDADASAKPFFDYLPLAILAAIFCCPPLGLPAIIFAAYARAYHLAGDHGRAQHNLNQAKIWFWITVGVGVLIQVGLLGSMVQTIITVLEGI